MQHDDSIRRAKLADPIVIGRGTHPAAGLGAVTLTWSERGVTRLDFDSRAGDPPALDPVPARIGSVLTAYFAGENVDPAREIDVDLVGTPFQLAVWGALRRIPRGTVRTYASIALDVGSPRMRAVGLANGANPVAISSPAIGRRARPCGGGFSAGIDHEIWLLEREGVKVSSGRSCRGSGCCDAQCRGAAPSFTRSRRAPPARDPLGYIAERGRRVVSLGRVERVEVAARGM